MADLPTDGTLADALLPRASLPYEEAHLQAMIEAWPLDFDAIPRERDPLRCRIENLIFLFFGRGGTYWNDRWLEAKKRAYVRDLPVYKRLEGTPLGVELYANLEGAFMHREELPPGRVFAVRDTALNHAQELALMPELRLYHRWPDRALNRAVAFAGRMAAGRGFAARDRATVLPRYPVLYEPRTGAETPLAVVDVDRTASTATLAKPGLKGHATFAGQAYAGRCYAARSVRQAPIVADLADPAMETVVVSPPCRRQQLAAAKGKVAGRVFAMPILGDVGTYDRLYLYDATRIQPGAGRAGRAFFAGQRIGVAPYTIFLHLAVPGLKPSHRGRAKFAGRFYALGRRLQPLHDAMRALGTARRPGDQIYVVLTPPKAGSRLAPLPAIGDLA